jgi:hypothetical protein
MKPDKDQGFPAGLLQMSGGSGIFALSDVVPVEDDDGLELQENELQQRKLMMSNRVVIRW